MAHKVFILFLVLIGFSATIAVGVRGCKYYITPVPERPFLANYETMKPSGQYSHSLGTIGASLIVVGVATYSLRKRMRSLWNLGMLSRWLEFHIFLCLLGPVLVIYHTTFKAGGVAAISLWSMVSVAASGVVGRFLYAQIPRNIKGAELTSSQVQQEIDRLSTELSSSAMGTVMVQLIDKQLHAVQISHTLGGLFSAIIKLERVKRSVKHAITSVIKTSALPHQTAQALRDVAYARTLLLQRSLILTQVEKLFYYWHAVHLPFTVIMFITLALHIIVAILMGYSWQLW